MSANLVSSLRDTAEIALLPGFVRDESTQAADEIDRLRMENEALKGQLHEEIAANLAFREKGGALADEDMPTFCDRLLARIAELETDAERWRLLQRLPKTEVIRVLQCGEPAQRYKDPGFAYTLQELVDAAIAAAKEKST